MSAINIFDSAQVFAYLKNQLALGSSYDRLPAMLECASFCDSEDWLRELGNQWTGFDNVGAYADELINALDVHHWNDYPVKLMMEPAELEAFDQLPEVLTVYRGCYALNKWGFCWSLNRAIAERFPFCNRYGGEGRPLLVKATLKKSQVAALKLDRNEAEIVTFERPKCVSISTARMPAPRAVEVLV